MKLPGANIASHSMQLGQRLPDIDSSLKNKQIQDFVDMPERLRYNLPTVVHALPQVAAYARRMKPLMLSASANDKSMARFLAEVDEALNYTRSCGIDFRAAFTYAAENLMPLQLRYMTEHLPDESELTPRG
jgi:hypothetical protein